MPPVLTLLLVLATTPFETEIDRAFAGLQNNEWTAVAAALDRAETEQPRLFAANGFPYLRGRAAEYLADWERAREVFRKIAPDNPLYGLASWHAALDSLKLHDEASALQFAALLPENFPAELKMRLAREAGGKIALRIYQDLSTREARYHRAQAAGDSAALWALIREDSSDEIALDSARTVAFTATAPADQMTVAEVFANHREFEAALPLYGMAAADPVYAADARFRIARIHFQQEKYALAIEEYRALAADFAGTDWEKDSEYQIASCYWRLADFRNSEAAYQNYIRKYGPAGMKEAATRNLVDVYRALGENQKALATLDHALAGALSVSTRQVFLFTKAKILYLEKRYRPALAIFQQLGRQRLRSAPGAATAEEVEYLQALCQSKLGNTAAANVIWRKLARDPFSYYGRRAADKLGGPVGRSTPACLPEDASLAKSLAAEIASLQHPLRSEPHPAADALLELTFLHLWDEAAFWLNVSETRLPRRVAAAIAYLGGRYDRSIHLAERLPRSDSNRPLLYPAGFRRLICDAAATYKVDPQWLHAIIWQESKYDPDARSAAGARGLMQFIPETAGAVARAAAIPDVSAGELYDPALSIRLGAAYWASLMENFKTPEKALAAYNGGPDNVERWSSKSHDPELFVADIGFVETKKYIMLVFAAHAVYASLQK
jgi:soluble lytic murein transglycosylase-like protein/TolA-binding protein